jgi:hypothetical protein
MGLKRLAFSTTTFHLIIVSKTMYSVHYDEPKFDIHELVKETAKGKQPASTCVNTDLIFFTYRTNVGFTYFTLPESKKVNYIRWCVGASKDYYCASLS